MSINEIKKEIEKVEASIELERQKFDGLRQHMIAEIKPLIKAQLRQNVESEVKANADHTKELGLERLSTLKQKLTVLLDNSDDLVEEKFSDDQLWIYINYDIGDNRYAYEKQTEAENRIYLAIKELLGEAGKLLLEAGYIQLGGMYQSGTGFHRSLNLVSGNPVKANLIYRGPISNFDTLNGLLDEYAKEIETLHGLYVEAAHLKKELSTQEAINLWDEA